MITNFYTPNQTKYKVWLLLVLPLFIGGCNYFKENGSIDDWYRSEKSKIKTNSNRVIIPVKPVTVVSFRGNESGDPFDMRNLIKEAEAAAEEAGPDKNAPDLDRVREPLESFPLGSMQFVGTIIQLEKAENIGLVTAGGSIYQVKTGNYLGQSYGHVVAINETEIVLEERIRNATTNRWSKRERVINLVGLSKESLR